MKPASKLTNSVLALLCALLVTAMAPHGNAQPTLWIAKAPMPAGRGTAAAGAINGILYLAGGDAGGDAQNTALQAYNPATDSWTNLAPMPGGRYISEAAVISNKLYVVGG